MESAIRFHRAAEREAEEAQNWYQAEDLRVAERFQQALNQGTIEILEHPDRWPEYLAGTRCFQLKKFPYLLVYRIVQGRVEVIAVAHTSRRPGYWRRRKFVD